MRPFDSATHPATERERGPAASQRLDGATLPSWELEEWRYSPIEDLDFEHYETVGEADLTADELGALRAEYPTPNLVVTRNGVLVHAEGVATHDEPTAPRLAANGDIFGDINEVFGTTTTVVTVKPGAMVTDDVVIVHLIDVDGAAVFPRLIVDRRRFGCGESA